MPRFTLDLRYAIRALARTPTFTVSAVLILGLAIGMAVAMTSVAQSVLVRRLPVVDQDRIVVLWTHRDDPSVEMGGRRGDLEALNRDSRLVRHVAGIAHWGATSAPLLDGDRPLVLNRALVTGEFFPALGSRPHLGRLFTPEDDLPGASGVIVLSYATWRKQFGADSGIVGRMLTEPYSRSQFRIVGVAPPGLDYPSSVGYWIPAWPGDDLSVTFLARLVAGATPESAREEFLSIMQRLPPTNRELQGARVFSFTDAVLGDVRPVLTVLTAAVALLLLIAAVNVGNLILLRAASRGRELAIRRALGASYHDVVRQLVMESAIMAMAGGALGLFVAMGCVRLLVAWAPARLPRLDVIGIAGTPLLVAFCITTLSLLVFGLAPAFVAARGTATSSLRLGSRAGTESIRRRHGRQMLVSTQVALALVMLAGAGLLVRSLERLQRVELGYNPDHLSILSVSWNGTRYDAMPKWLPLGDQLMTQIRALPGVTSVSPIQIPPFLGANVFHGRLDLEGQTPEEVQSNPTVPVEVGNADYFRTMGIPIIRGRGFAESDRETSEPVAVVSEAVARRAWPGQDAVGKRIKYWGPDTLTWRTVIGVAGDIRFRSLREATPTIYLPYRQAYWQIQFAMRTSVDVAPLVETIRQRAREVDPELSVWNIEPMADALAGQLAQPRLSTLMLSAFAAVALLLAAIGLYGVMASAVREQTREIGVRMALGATPARVRGSILGRALGMTAAGAAAGLVGALVASRLLGGLLFEVGPADPLTLTGVCLLLGTVGALAAWLPARRATRIDPAQALRAE
jgi:putative ABC transport system permease protein